MEQNKENSTISVIIDMLKRRLSYEIISKCTGYTTNEIIEIHKKYLPESFLSQSQMNDNIIEVLQTINKGHNQRSDEEER